MLLELLKSLILGVVEGITEWLPISSTGHMILVNELIKNYDGFTASDLYIYVIQLGAILAVVTLYFRKLNPFALSKTKEERSETWQMWFKVIAACIPAAIIGILMDSFMDKIETWYVVAATLIIYGFAFIVIENLNRKEGITRISEMSYKTAVLIGLFQVLSIVPGTSRSGATILGAMLVGCSRSVAAEFSFFLAIPVMFGVSILKIAKNGLMMTGGEWLTLLTGMAIAYIVSMLAIKFLVDYVRKHDFKAFGYYRIALGIIVIIFISLRAIF